MRLGKKFCFGGVLVPCIQYRSISPDRANKRGEAWAFVGPVGRLVEVAVGSAVGIAMTVQVGFVVNNAFFSWLVAAAPAGEGTRSVSIKSRHHGYCA
jgi:hypothetical protein